MKEYLFDTFLFNDMTNKKLLNKISELPDKTQSIKLFSHLINCQYRWMARITQNRPDNEMSWWRPLYTFDQLGDEWNKSIQPWLDYFSPCSGKALETEVVFIGTDGGEWAVSIQDIALQLNYHSFHHRAQIQSIIREQVFEPETLDYIRTKYRKLSE